MPGILDLNRHSFTMWIQPWGVTGSNVGVGMLQRGGCGQDESSGQGFPWDRVRAQPVTKSGPKLWAGGGPASGGDMGSSLQGRAGKEATLGLGSLTSGHCCLPTSPRAALPSPRALDHLTVLLGFEPLELELVILDWCSWPDKQWLYFYLWVSV